jgi:hypothetical protein
MTAPKPKTKPVTTPTLASLRKLAKRKGYPFLERRPHALQAMPGFSTDLNRHPYIELRFHATHEATARSVFHSALLVLPDVKGRK